MILGPTSDDDILALADWLELRAFFAPDCSARLDEIDNALGIEQECENEDIADADSQQEGRASVVADEISRRGEALNASYPFSMSDNGEKLNFLENNSFGRLSYLICLIINNSWNSGKLQAPLRLTDGELRASRDIFEVVALFAALGRTRGPAFLIGTNRSGAGALLARVHHLCEVVGEGRARNEVIDAAPPAANDDGVDIIAVELEPDGPPTRLFSFGQSASGKNFDGKPIKNLVDGFLDIWFQDRPLNTEAVMYIPAILPERELRYYTGRLGNVVHRPRVAYFAQLGFDLYEQRPDLVHFLEDFGAPSAFYEAYKARVM